MEILVVYDICTSNKVGERRLREVAKICEGYGQRVQKSVFECGLSRAQLRMLINELDRTIDHSLDSVGIYHLREPFHRYVETLGKRSELDWRGPVIL